MSGTVKVFGYAVDGNGVRVVILREPISSGCLTDEAVDAELALLKANLDALAKPMKAAAKKQRSAPLEF